MTIEGKYLGSNQMTPLEVTTDFQPPESNKLQSVGKEVVKKMLDKIKSILTLRDVFYILVGVCLALFICFGIYHWHMDNAVLLKGLVYKGKPYDVVPRP